MAGLWQEASILDSQENLNLRSVETLKKHFCFSPDWVVYVVHFPARYGAKNKTGRTVAVTDNGGGMQDWAVGTRHSFRADQSCRDMGYGTVVGIWELPGERIGDVPAKTLKHFVFK
jgi:hypothetical protein